MHNMNWLIPVLIVAIVMGVNSFTTSYGATLRISGRVQKIVPE